MLTQVNPKLPMRNKSITKDFTCASLALQQLALLTIMEI